MPVNAEVGLSLDPSANPIFPSTFTLSTYRKLDATWRKDRLRVARCSRRSMVSGALHEADGVDMGGGGRGPGHVGLATMGMATQNVRQFKW